MSSRPGKNIVWLLITQSATWIVSFALLIIVPRQLGDVAYGDLAYATIFVQYFTLVAGLETGQLLIKLVARDHSIVGPYVRNALVMKVLLVAVLSVVAVLFASLIGQSGEMLVLIGVGCVGMLLSTLNTVLSSVLAGMERMAKPAMWLAVQVYVGGIVGVFLLAIGGGVVAYATALALAFLIPLVANFAMLWPQIKGHWRIDFSVWGKLVGGGLPLLLLTAFNLIYGTIDFPILEAITDSATVGWYAVAYRWATIPIFMCTAVVGAYFPLFSAHGATMSSEFARTVNKAIKLVLLVSVPAACGLLAVAGDLLDVVYNGEFEESVVPLQILSLHIPVAGLTTILATALVASDHIGKYLFVAGTAAVITPIVLFPAINASVDAYDNGAIGAAIVTTSIEMCVLVGAVVLRAPGVLDRATTSFSLRCTAAGAAIVLVVLLVRDWPLIVQVPLGAVTYVAALLALRVVTVTELKTMTSRAINILRRTPAPEVAEPVDETQGG